MACSSGWLGKPNENLLLWLAETTTRPEDLFLWLAETTTRRPAPVAGKDNKTKTHVAGRDNHTTTYSCGLAETITQTEDLWLAKTITRPEDLLLWLAETKSHGSKDHFLRPGRDWQRQSQGSCANNLPPRELSRLVLTENRWGLS